MHPLNLDQLRAFLAVVRHGGVNKAAHILHLTQPAVTSRLKRLEETLGTELFERFPGRLKLTKRGELLQTFAEQFERLSDKVEETVVAKEGIDRHLRIGASETIAQCWLPDLVAELRSEYPNLIVEINVDISVNLRAALMDREIDLALLLGPVSEYSVDNVELPGFELAWYVQTGTGTEDGAALLREKPVITYARHTRPYRELKTLLQERVATDVQLFPSSSLSACFRLVEAGLGVAALPKVLAQPYVETGRIEEFAPGWVPDALRFSASYLGDPRSHVVAAAAQKARAVADAYSGYKDPL